ncbi:MAG: hypothetical protein R6W90_13375 [Ignavibacteriaceae bacterium]
MHRNMIYNEKNPVYAGENIISREVKSVQGELLMIGDEQYYKISNFNLMPPFLMNIVSNTDLWMFISSSGALTAGRRNPDNALFPYYTDDRIHDSHDITGNKTIIFADRNSNPSLWEPFSSSCYEIYNIERNIYKNITGNKLIFEEINFDLSLSYQYTWMNCDKFGFIKKSKLVNNNPDPVQINILDGIQNILPYGADRKFQLEYSTLLDGYKKNELLEETGLALFALSSIPTDKAEPSEALRVSSVWSAGLENAIILLSSKQLCSFKKGKPVQPEKIICGVRGSFLLQSEFKLEKAAAKEWYIAADVNKDQSDIALLSLLLQSKSILKEQIENEIHNDTAELNLKIAKGDGYQLTNDPLITSRHFANVLFNIMRGGLFDNNYVADRKDFSTFVKNANINLWNKYSSLLEDLPEQICFTELINRGEKLNDPDLLRLCYEYLPLTFSRRHGDPSRPWNIFSIDVKDEHGSKVLNYQGNWRDIFQNWEALAHSFPGYIENMIVKFVNASTADGYNPYKITKDGFEWEVLDPSDTWSYIGYWGDHQTIYLHKLLELSVQYHPGFLVSFLSKEIFTYANVPYRIKPYEDITNDPHNTINFDYELDLEIKKRVDESGTDGKYIYSGNKEVYRVNLSEKLLLSVLTRLSNFIPEAGIWMNTQRPEWNDANNALVGSGASMVTLYYLRKFISFNINLFREIKDETIIVSDEVLEFFSGINQALSDFIFLLSDRISDTDRKKLTDKLGKTGSIYRTKIYKDGFSGGKNKLPANELVQFFELALNYIDHSILANKRNDDLFHSYNLIKYDGNKISIRYLYEMLEGQAAVLSSGYLSAEEANTILNALRRSRLYRQDQSSYMLYPDRELPRFTEKNIIPLDLLEQSQLLQSLIRENDKSIVVRDINGDIHFNSTFRNASYLKQALNELQNSHTISDNEIEIILGIYEGVFDHQSFTGRSGTFYKYEGLGSIYWHMVSKLLVSIQDIFYHEHTETSTSSLSKLKDCYYKIREGIGVHKSPELYGAFPTDPYSHTPAGMGAQQPGMTGQVKEDVISRFGELGVLIKEGEIHFNPALLNEEEFLNKSRVYQYYDVNGRYQTLMLNPGMLAFTICQVPVIYIQSKNEKIILSRKEDIEEEINGLVIGRAASKLIFQREGIINRIKVLIDK